MRGKFNASVKGLLSAIIANPANSNVYTINFTCVMPLNLIYNGPNVVLIQGRRVWPSFLMHG